MTTKYVSVTITEDKQQAFDDALSDVICWMDGYQAAGGTYTPNSVDRLREIRTTILKAYHTIAPKDEAVSKEPEWPKWFIDGDGDLYKFDGPEQRGERWRSSRRDWVGGKNWVLKNMTTERYIADGYKPIHAAEAKSILKK